MLFNFKNLNFKFILFICKGDRIFEINQNSWATKEGYKQGHAKLKFNIVDWTDLKAKFKENSFLYIIS